ncbi:MAG: aldehyde dehydrogenase family protein [Alphaproteobacteria bacterium]
MDQFANKIGADWRDGELLPNRNPSDPGDVIGLFARATAEDTREAIAAARAALPAWARMVPHARGQILRRASDLMLARKDALGRALSREEGKTLAEGVGEVTRAAQILDFFAAETVRIPGESLASLRPGVEVTVRREPVGVVGIITPWNFPIAIPAWKIAPALAYGNTVVFKPAELVPHSAWSLVSILHEAGLPDGVLNLICGPGAVVGEEIATNPVVDAVSFTGSVATGRRLAATCAGRFCKVQLEMGGKNPLVILDDADLPQAVECAVNGAFFSTGQRCTASSRLIVTEGIHDRFVTAMRERMGQLRVGNALDPATQIGPVVDPKQLETDLGYLTLARQEGATLAAGGEVIGTSGHFLTPALLTEATNSMRSSREEIFGPVASVIRVRDFDEALATANDTDFGLTAGICTNSLKHVQIFKAQARAGMVMVNLPTAGVDFHVPFGGTKGSSYGAREQGRAAVEFYTTVKTSYIG